MTYKLNPIIEKCTSPVKIIFNGTTGNSEASLRKTAEVQTWNLKMERLPAKRFSR